MKFIGPLGFIGEKDLTEQEQVTLTAFGPTMSGYVHIPCPVNLHNTDSI